MNDSGFYKACNNPSDRFIRSLKRVALHQQRYSFAFLYQFSARPEVKEAYDMLAPQYEIICAEIECRRAIGMTQKELAQQIGTAQSNISCFESGNYNPSLAFLQKMA